MKRVYLSLGSNLGDRRAYLAQALEEMRAAGIRVERVSSLYETEPVGSPGHRPQGGWFLNCAVEAQTELMPRQLLRRLRRIEQRLGRKRSGRNSPRTVDLDILLYEDRVMNTAELALPHPRLAERRFVLVPLAELAPGLRHPTLRKTVAELLAKTPDRSRVRRWRG